MLIKVIKEISLENYEFTPKDLTSAQCRKLEGIIVDTMGERSGNEDFEKYVDADQLDDFLRYDKDLIADWLGFKDYDQLIRYNTYGDDIDVLVTDIKWDTSDSEEDEIENLTLPTEVHYHDEEYNGDDEELMTRIADWLSDTYGYCHDGFNYEIQGGNE